MFSLSSFFAKTVQFGKLNLNNVLHTNGFSDCSGSLILYFRIVVVLLQYIAFCLFSCLTACPIKYYMYVDQSLRLKEREKLHFNEITWSCFDNFIFI